MLATAKVEGNFSVCIIFLQEMPGAFQKCGWSVCGLCGRWKAIFQPYVNLIVASLTSSKFNCFICFVYVHVHVVDFLPWCSPMRTSFHLYGVG